MIISEKQLIMLLQVLTDSLCITEAEEIVNQQSEELKVIE